MGEEWRRGWHPERIEARHADQSVLVVGSGPAGLEAACALGQRGYRVILAEAEQELGGRINRESRLPGLAEYARIRDWRLGQLQRMVNVDIYPDNRLDADAIAELECEHVIVATGASWRSDGVGRWRNSAFAGCDSGGVIGVEHILRGKIPEGRVVIYDDDHYYLGSAIALLASVNGCQVVLVSPADSLAEWSHHTDEHRPIMQALIAAGVECMTAKGLVGFAPGMVQLECVYSGQSLQLAADQLIPISTRVADDALWIALDRRRSEFLQHGLLSLQRIGDCHAPGIIAAAVYAGHKAARELGGQQVESKRDRVVV
jgi:dimethylamine/trimethylamine dehydrogenase